MPIVLRLLFVSFAFVTVGCVNTGASTLYYGTGNTVPIRGIHYMPVEGGPSTKIISASPAELAFDSSGENLIIGSTNLNAYSLDGTWRKTLARQQQVYSIALDKKNNHIYWISRHSNSRQRIIERANLEDGTERTVLVSGLRSVSDVAVDPKRGWLYWTQSSNGSQSPAGLWRAKLDGTSAKQIPLLHNHPKQMAINSRNGDLYWEVTAPGNTSEIRTGQGDGSGEITLVTGLLWEVEDLALDSKARKLYWAERAMGTAPDRLARIRRCNLDGSGIETIREVRRNDLFFTALALGYAPDAPGEKESSRIGFNRGGNRMSNATTGGK